MQPGQKRALAILIRKALPWVITTVSDTDDGEEWREGMELVAALTEAADTLDPPLED